MEFLKKHYEKIILSAVLLGLAAATFWFSIAVGDAQKQITNILNKAGPPKPLKPVDLTADIKALGYLTNPPPLVLSGEHNLFNPVTWKARRDGVWFKVLREGAAALVVTDIRPLYFTIGYDRKSGDGFYLYLQRQSGFRTHPYITWDDKKPTKERPFILHGIKGATNDPTGLDLELDPDGEIVTVTKDKPFQRIDGYETDMKYEPDASVLKQRRVITNEFFLSGEPYKIIAITNNAVTVQNTRTTQRTIINWTNGPSRTNP